MIKLTDNALLRLRELRKKNDKNFVRLDVKGGGCAGFEYQWSYANEEQRNDAIIDEVLLVSSCLLYTSPSPRDQRGSRMPSSA